MIKNSELNNHECLNGNHKWVLKRSRQPLPRRMIGAIKVIKNDAVAVIYDE